MVSPGLAAAARAGRVNCDDCHFAEFGDMFTLRELRHSGPLRSSTLETRRLRYIAELETAGVDEDIDPGAFTGVLQLTPDGPVITDWQRVRVPPPEEHSV